MNTLRTNPFLPSQLTWQKKLYLKFYGVPLPTDVANLSSAAKIQQAEKSPSLAKIYQSISENRRAEAQQWRQKGVKALWTTFAASLISMVSYGLDGPKISYLLPSVPGAASVAALANAERKKKSAALNEYFSN